MGPWGFDAFLSHEASQIKAGVNVHKGLGFRGLGVWGFRGLGV